MVEKPKPTESPILVLVMRKCSVPECGFSVFGTDKNTKKGYCKYHQNLRTDIKKRIRRNSLKKKNEKLARNKQGFDPFQWGYESELEMFQDLWAGSNKKSVVSGRELEMFVGREQWLNCFAHVLSKKNFPLYRFNTMNILLVHPYEHYLVDHGTVTERIDYVYEYPEADFNVFYDLQETLKEEYNNI